MERRTFLRSAAGLGVTAMFAVPPAQGRPGMSVATALNLAGRQRMLSQRLAKAWVMRGLDILSEHARGILDESLAQQQTQLAELKGFVPNGEARAALAPLERDWAAYRGALAVPPVRDRAQPVYDLSEQVQERAHRLTLAYERASRVPSEERLVNVAGRQRMLSQRIAKFHLFRVWSVNPAAARMELNYARAEFSSGMHQLANAVAGTRALRTALDEVDREWIAYRRLLETPGEGTALRRVASQIVEHSERLLTMTERLATLFVERAEGAGHRSARVEPDFF